MKESIILEDFLDNTVRVIVVDVFSYFHFNHL